MRNTSNNIVSAERIAGNVGIVRQCSCRAALPCVSFPAATGGGTPCLDGDVIIATDVITGCCFCSFIFSISNGGFCPAALGTTSVLLVMVAVLAVVLLSVHGGTRAVHSLIHPPSSEYDACGEGLLHNFDSFLCCVCFSSFGDDERVSVVYVNIFIFDIAILVALDVTSCGSGFERTV